MPTQLETPAGSDQSDELIRDYKANKMTFGVFNHLNTDSFDHPSGQYIKSVNSSIDKLHQNITITPENIIPNANSYENEGKIISKFKTALTFAIWNLKYNLSFG